MSLLTELEWIRTTNYKDVAPTALAKNGLAAGAGGVKVSAAMKTLLTKAKIGLLFCLLSLALTAAGQQWTQTTSLPDGYEDQSLVYWNGFLYQAGGHSNLNGILDGINVFYAQVHTNGTIGSWNVATLLPQAVFYHAGVVASGFLYILGGYHYSDQMGIFITNTVYYARINPDGSVGAWQTANPLPRALAWMSAAVWNGRIYVAGGGDDTSLYADVWSAQIQSDGSLSPWAAQTPLPNAVYMQAAVANGLLYVLGGTILKSSGAEEFLSNVFYSRINPDGTLAGWNQTTPMPAPLAGFGAVAAQGQIFVLCGLVGGTALTNSFFSVPVAGDGSLGKWFSGPHLPLSIYRGHGNYLFGTAVTDSFIFVAGGTDGGADFNNVFYLGLPPLPATPLLAPQRFGTNGAFQLRLTSTTNTGFGLLTSTNLTTWTNIGWGFTGTNGSLLWQDTNAANFPNRFYRAYWPLP